MQKAGYFGRVSTGTLLVLEPEGHVIQVLRERETETERETERERDRETDRVRERRRENQREKSAPTDSLLQYQKQLFLLPTGEEETLKVLNWTTRAFMKTDSR